ncbi:MAG: hypothetical protein ABIH00_02000 [Armatimonadota bacterium]
MSTEQTRLNVDVSRAAQGAISFGQAPAEKIHESWHDRGDGVDADNKLFKYAAYTDPQKQTWLNLSKNFGSGFDGLV